MKYLMIKDYSEFETAKNNLVSRVEDAYKKDKSDSNGSVSLCFLDEKVAQMVKNKFRTDFFDSWQLDHNLKNKSKHVKIIDAWTCEFYYGAAKKEFYTSLGSHYKLISYKDTLFDYSFLHSKTTASLFLFNDWTNYAKLPESKKPNRMGVITDRGIEAWYQYLTERKKEADKLNLAADQKWFDLCERIKKVAEERNIPCGYLQVPENYYEIKDYDVIIRINGIQAKFSYDHESGQIGEQMMLYTYGFKDSFMDLFLKLSDNGLGK
jgi:hypothetical protein